MRIEGSGFGAAPFVTFGAGNVAAFQSESDTLLEVVVPPDQVGPANITVVAASGARTTALAGYYYLPIAAIPFAPRFYANAASSSSANLVLVLSTNDRLTGIDLELPRAASGAIAGRLLGPAGEPLVGHAVIATPQNGGDAIAMPSGVDGRYRIDGLVPGEWIVTTRESRTSPLVDEAFAGVEDAAAATPVTVLADQVADGVDFTLGTGATITGQVRGGAPLENVTVFALDAAGRSLQFTYATTDSAGLYSLRGLAPGSYRLVAFAPGGDRVSGFWPDAFDYASATPIAVSGTGAVTADFDLALGATISGQVIEAGSLLPIPRVVLVGHEVTRDLDFTTATGVDGTYALPPIPAGSYRLEAPELGQFYDAVTTTAGATLVLVTSGAASPGRNWLGRLDHEPSCGSPATTATFSGKVTGPGGAAVLRAVVTLVGPTIASTTSGVDGRWTLGCLPPGTWSIDVHVPGSDFPRRTATAFATVLPASTTQIDVTLSHGPVLKGQIRDSATHAPLANVLVEAHAQAGGETGFTVTAPDGTWRLDRFPSGGLNLDSYVIEAPGSVQTEYFPD